MMLKIIMTIIDNIKGVPKMLECVILCKNFRYTFVNKLLMKKILANHRACWLPKAQ